MSTLDPFILSLLPDRNSPAPSWMSTSELIRQLKERGHDIRYSKQLVRALKALEQENLVDGREIGRTLEWQRKTGATGINKGAMGLDEALALQILQRYSTHQLPELAQKTLKGLFDMAATRLKRSNDAREQQYADWPLKIAMMGGGFQLVRPKLDDKAFYPITNALFTERILKITYRKPGSADKPQAYKLMPLALVESAEGLLYLVAKTFYQDGFVPNPARYRVDRIASAKVDDESFPYPPDFNLTKYIEKDRAMEFFEEQATAVVLRVSGFLAQLLQETPISEDQRVTQNKDGSVTIHATVVPSMRFRWWVLAHDAQIEVMSPKRLRTEIKQKIEAMYQLYS